MSIRVRTVPAKNGLNWVKQAIKIFLSAPHFLLLPMFIFSLLLAVITGIAPTGMMSAILVPAFSLQLYLITEQIATARPGARPDLMPTYRNSLTKLRDNWQPLLTVGLIYALVNTLGYSFMSSLLSDFLTALEQLSITNETAEELQIIISKLMLEHINSNQITMLLISFFLHSIVQNYLIVTAILLVKAKCNLFQALFYTGYIIYKNWAAIVLFVLSIGAILLLISLLSVISSILQPVALFLFFGLLATSFCIYYVCLNDCLIID